MADATPDPRALVEATRLFLARHEEALASGDPRRALEACDGLLVAVQGTIPQETRAEERGLADEVLARRLAECEGVVLQLQLALRNLEARRGDVFRLVALLTAARRTLRGVLVGLELWAHARGGPRPDRVDPLEALRAAREALLANVPEAAAASLTAALRAGLAHPVGLPSGAGVAESAPRWSGGALRFDPEVAVALEAQIAPTRDAVVAWDHLARVEALLDAAGMSRPP